MSKFSPKGNERAANLLSKLSPRRLLRAVFVDQLRLRRDGASLKLELADPDLPPASALMATGAAAAASAAADSPARQMRRALSELLDSRPDSRLVLRHLAALEHHLEVQAQPFLHNLSLSSLQHMLRQLHGLVAPPASRGVSLLMSELLDAVEQKSLADPTRPGVQPISSFFVDHKMEVTELSPSALDELVGPSQGTTTTEVGEAEAARGA